MEPKKLKRTHYEVMKNDLCVALHNLTIDSAKYNTDVHSATEDFEQMLKSIADRQAQFLTQSMLIEEQYGATIVVLEGRNTEAEGESSGENVVLATTYAQDTEKFVHDCKTSLNGHAVFLREEYDQMQTILAKYANLLKDNMEEMKMRAINISDQKSKLSSALYVFNRTVPDVSDEEED